MKRKRNKAENTIDKSYKCVLYPNKEQISLIEKTFGCCRYVYNRFLDERISAYRDNGITVSYSDQCRQLPVLKADPETAWLKEVDSTALQYTVRILQDSFDNFFRHPGKTGYPKFKSKRSHRQSYHSMCTNGNIRVIDGKHIRLPKLGVVRCRIPMKVEGRILGAAVTRDATGKYAVVLHCEVPKPAPLPDTGRSVGVDLGIRTLAVTSDGKEYGNNRTYAKNLKKLARAQKKLSRKTKGSHNREKQRIKVAKIHQKIHDQRLDAVHKMTHELVREYDVISIEDLDTREMIKGRFAKDISDASWREIRRQLTYKSEWAGRQLIVVDRWYPSSQTCSVCGHVSESVKDLSVRQWTCPECGSLHDRDVNAARNILREGLRKAG